MSDDCPSLYSLLAGPIWLNIHTAYGPEAAMTIAFIHMQLLAGEIPVRGRG